TFQLSVAAGLGHGLAGIAARVVVDGIAVVTLLRILRWASNRLSSAVTTEFDHAGGRAAIARTVVAIVAAFTQASLESAVATVFYPASGGPPVAIVGVAIVTSLASFTHPIAADGQGYAGIAASIVVDFVAIVTLLGAFDHPVATYNGVAAIGSAAISIASVGPIV